MITLYKKIERCLFKGVSSLFARCSSLLLIFQTSDMILTSVGLSHYTLGRATMELSDVPHTVRGCDSQHNWGCYNWPISPGILNRCWRYSQTATVEPDRLRRSCVRDGAHQNTQDININKKISKHVFTPLQNSVIQDILGYLTCIISYTCLLVKCVTQEMDDNDLAWLVRRRETGSLETSN